MKRVLAAIGMVLCLAANSASADVDFSLSGAALSDGGTLSGTFTTNDALTALLDFDFTTSGGALTGFEYTPTTAPVSFSSLPNIIVVETTLGDRILELTFIGGLTATGGTILVGQFDSFEQVDTQHRQIVAGEAVVGTAPEPATLLLLGIAALGFATRSRARRD